MTDKILDIINASFPLMEKDAGEFAKAKVSVMTFESKCYEAQGLGNVCVMTGTAMMGLMKMVTVVLNPFDRDMPLMSYDRIYAMGNDTLLLEVYETRLDKSVSFNSLEEMQKRLSNVPDKKLEQKWYDSIRIVPVVAKIGKKKNSAEFDKFTSDYITEFISKAVSAPVCDRAEKKKSASVYTEGLLNNGGASTDQFIKAKGKDYTQRFFREVFFGTGTPD